MGHVNTIFHQILSFVRRNQFQALADQLEADRYVKNFNSWNHLVTMIFSQAADKDSLRDLEGAFNAQANSLYHLGAKPVHRSTISDANNRRPWQLFQQTYDHLLRRFQDLRPGHTFKFKNPLYSFDSTIVDLCLAMFDWAKFRARKGAVKMHYRLSHDGIIPEIMILTDGKKHDVKVAPQLAHDLKPDSIISFDRAYIDFKFLFSLTQRRIWFVTRAKKNLDYRVIGQHLPPKNKNVIADLVIQLQGPKTQELYPQNLRLIIFIDPIKNKRLVFITNNFQLAAATIAEIYKARWQIETFFKWIKQNLKLKSFMGTSKNAVLIQVWCALIYYLILAFIKAQSRYLGSLHLLTQIIGTTIFHRAPLLELLDLNANTINLIKQPPPLQMSLPLML
jgi:Transposase DDE domain/Domain of unknown function (DUF4372)